MTTTTTHQAPHSDLPRVTPEGAWLTECRTRAGMYQCDLAVILGAIDPRLRNPGRVSEIETGKRILSRATLRALHREFQKRLGDRCPPLPA